MKGVYLDANVYNDVVRGNVAAEEVQAFRDATRRGELTPHLSLADLEEFLGVWETDRRVALERLRLARDLVGFKGLLKQPGDLVRDEIQAYARGASPPPPTLPRRYRRYLSTCLNKVVEGSTNFDDLISRVVADVRANKEAFKAQMAQSRAQALAKLTGIYDPAVLRQLSFQKWWTAAAVNWAEDFARPFGLADACRQRGLDGLLTVRTIRVFVGTVMSLVHSQVAEGRQPDFGDGYDLWHAILASVADVFVTGDKGLAGHLARIPTADGFRVVTSLRELLTGSRPADSR